METVTTWAKPAGIEFSRIARAAAYSSLYLSFAGGAMVYISCSLQNLSFNHFAALIMILVTYGVYNLNRKTDEAEDSINHFERYSFTKKYGNVLCRTAALAYLGAAGLGIFFGAGAFIITMIPLFSGVIYSIPLLPGRTGFSRIKEVPVLKSVVVALAWAIPPAFLPLYIARAGISQQTWIVALLFFILVFVNTVVFDIRDIKGDRNSGVKTIPVILGAETTVLALSCLNTGAGIFILISGYELFNPLQIAFLLFCIIYAQLYLLVFRNRKADKIMTEILIDGQFILLSGVLAVFPIIYGYLPVIS